MRRTNLSRTIAAGQRNTENARTNPVPEPTSASKTYGSNQTGAGHE